MKEQKSLLEIQELLIEAHNQLAKSGLSANQYNPISSYLVKAKLKLYKLLCDTGSQLPKKRRTSLNHI